MGLTGGFADVGSLYDCLAGIHQDLLTPDILDKYSEIRIKLWREMIDPMSRANFRRLWAEDAVEEREKFFEMCDKAAKDEDLAAEFANVSVVVFRGKVYIGFEKMFADLIMAGYSCYPARFHTVLQEVGDEWC